MSARNGHAVDDPTGEVLAHFLAAEGAAAQAEAVLAACIVTEARATDARQHQETVVFGLQAAADQARSALRQALGRVR